MNSFRLYDEVENKMSQIKQLPIDELEKNGELVDSYCRSLMKLIPYSYKRAFYKNSGLATEPQSNNMEEIANIENDISEQKQLKFLGLFRAVYGRNPIPLSFEEKTGKKFNPEIHIAFEIYFHSVEDKNILGGFYTLFAIYELT